MAKLKVKFVLNRGRHGAPLGKFGKISEQVERFLIALTQDCGAQARQGEWVAADFENGSVAFDVDFQGSVEQHIAASFQKNLEFLADFDPDTEGLNGLMRENTALEYAKIGYLIDPDEEIGLGIVPVNGGKPKWRAITYAKAENIRTNVESPLLGYGSLQGIVHSWFKEALVPYFQFRELATNKLVKVQYRANQYEEVVKAFRQRNMILLISGDCSYDRASRDLFYMRLDRMSETSSLTPVDFDKLFGSFPDFECEEAIEDAQ